jgi:Mg-chelatase subunit ChlD
VPQYGRPAQQTLAQRVYEQPVPAPAPSYSSPQNYAPQPGYVQTQNNGSAAQSSGLEQQAGNGGQKGWVDAFALPSAVNGNAAPSFRQDATNVRVKPKIAEPLLDSGITARDLHILEQHDVAIVVDRSSSMTTQDCPGISANPSGGWQMALAGLMGAGAIPGYNMRSGTGMSRWEFVQSQTMALAKQTQQIFPHGVMLVLFSSHCKVFQNVDLRQIPNIFSANHPWGSTNTAEALDQPIEDYLNRRQATGGHVKPLVIAVITDGMPTNPDALRRLIINTTHRVGNAHEIRITFLQIGTERKGFEELDELDRYLVNEGARFDIVDTKMFPQVVQAGLARSLVDAIESNPNQ